MRLNRQSHEWDGIPAWCWPKIARELPPLKKKPFLRARRKGGRPRVDDRLALSAVLWRLRGGGIWDRLPERFGSSVTARRRLARWLRDGRLERAWNAYLEQQSLLELQRWRDALAAGSVRSAPFWRMVLELVWRREFAPKVPGP